MLDTLTRADDTGAKATRSQKTRATRRAAPLVGLSIGHLAQYIAEIRAVQALANEAKCMKERRGFQGVEQEAYYRLDPAQDLVMRLEPENLNDVLSLAILVVTTLEHINTDVLSETEKRGARSAEGALHAICRGLLRAGAKSPLLSEMNRNHLLTHAERTTMAREEQLPR